MGAKNSPSGFRLRGGMEAVRREAPRIGGSFAVWGGLFSTFDCSLVALRRKEVRRRRYPPPPGAHQPPHPPSPPFPAPCRPPPFSPSQSSGSWQLGAPHRVREAVDGVLSPIGAAQPPELPSPFPPLFPHLLQLLQLPLAPLFSRTTPAARLVLVLARPLLTAFLPLGPSEWIGHRGVRGGGGGLGGGTGAVGRGCCCALYTCSSAAHNTHRPLCAGRGTSNGGH